MILTGPAGSGKTLMLAEILKTKVAHFKRQGIPTQIIIATFEKIDRQANLLRSRGFTELFKLGDLMAEFGIKAKTCRELFRGKILCIRMNKIKLTIQFFF